MEKVFVYGTLRPSLYPGVIKRFGLRDLTNGRDITIQGFAMYSLGAFPCLVPDKSKSPVHGELIGVKDLHELDRYESYDPKGDGLYDRMMIITSTGDKAWVYFMRDVPYRNGLGEIKSKDWKVRR